MHIVSKSTEIFHWKILIIVFFSVPGCAKLLWRSIKMRFHADRKMTRWRCSEVISAVEFQSKLKGHWNWECRKGKTYFLLFSKLQVQLRDRLQILSAMFRLFNLLLNYFSSLSWLLKLVWIVINFTDHFYNFNHVLL